MRYYLRMTNQTDTTLPRKKNAPRLDAPRVQFGGRIETELDEAIRKEAARLGKTVSEIYVEGARLYLRRLAIKRKRKAARKARKIPVGTYTDTAPNLEINPSNE